MYISNAVQRRLSGAATHLLGQWEEVLMQGEHGSVKSSVVRVPGDHARVLLHAVPVSWGGNATGERKPRGHVPINEQV